MTVRSINHTIEVTGLQSDDAAVVMLVAENLSTGNALGPFEGTSKRATGDPRDPAIGEALAVLRAVRRLGDHIEEGLHEMAGGYLEGASPGPSATVTLVSETLDVVLASRRAEAFGTVRVSKEALLRLANAIDVLVDAS